MANFFTLVSYHGADRDTFYLENQLPSGRLSIGWGEVNPIGSTPEKIRSDIQTFYPDRQSTNNPWNGQESLPVFCELMPGDLVFVRGSAKILDIAIIAGRPFYSYGNGHDGGFDYCTMVPFVPFLENVRAGVLTRLIPDENYSNVLEERGRRLVMRRIQEMDALAVIKKIFDGI